MHPDILRELISQRGREMREQAHRARLVRMHPAQPARA